MGCGAAAITLPLIAHDWRLNLVALNPVIDTDSSDGCGQPTPEAMELLSKSAELFGADFAVMFDRGAERVRLMTRSGVFLDGDTALHALVDLWCRAGNTSDRTVAVPLTASLVVEEIAARHGKRVVRPGRTGRSLAQAVVDGHAGFAGGLEGEYLFGDFFPAFDGVLTVGMLARMLASVGLTLDQVVADLPPFFKASTDVPCSTARKGAVMRAVTEAASGMVADLTEGVRIVYDDGWALVLPDSVEPSVGVWAEAATDEAALERVRIWKAVVESGIERD